MVVPLYFLPGGELVPDLTLGYLPLF